MVQHIVCGGAVVQRIVFVSCGVGGAVVQHIVGGAVVQCVSWWSSGSAYCLCELVEQWFSVLFL